MLWIFHWYFQNIVIFATKLLWSNLIFRFVPTVVTTQKCEPFVRENCSMIMKTVCNEVCKEECEVKDKKVCMTIPHQECRETSQQLCKDIPRSECKKVNYRKYCIVDFWRYRVTGWILILIISFVLYTIEKTLDIY